MQEAVNRAHRSHAAREKVAWRRPPRAQDTRKEPPALFTLVDAKKPSGIGWERGEWKGSLPPGRAASRSVE